MHRIPSDDRGSNGSHQPFHTIPETYLCPVVILHPPPASFLSLALFSSSPLPDPPAHHSSSLPDRSRHLLLSRLLPPPPSGRAPRYPWPPPCAPQIRLDPPPPRLEPPPPTTSCLLPLTPPPARTRPTVLSPAASAAPRSGEGSQAAGMPAPIRVPPPHGGPNPAPYGGRR